MIVHANIFRSPECHGRTENFYCSYHLDLKPVPMGYAPRELFLDHSPRIERCVCVPVLSLFWKSFSVKVDHLSVPANMYQIKLLPRVEWRTFRTRLLLPLCCWMFVWIVLMIQVTEANHQHKHRFRDHHHRTFPEGFRRLVKHPRSLPDPNTQSTTYDQLPPFVETSSTNQDDQDDQQFQRPLSPPIRIIDFTSAINSDGPDTFNDTSGFNINDQRPSESDVNTGDNVVVDNGQIIGEDDPSIMDITYEDRHCPRDREEAKARGQSCLRKCNSHKDCISSKRRCLCDGLCGWSCIRPDLNCEELPNIPNSRYTLTNGNFFHSKLIYECDQGYILSGQRERLCQGDGSWSGWQPQCKSKPVCGSPPFIPHSKHTELIGTEFELNKTVQYECFNGYEPNGSTEAICVHRNDTVFWSIDLVCVRKNCGDPGHIENGYRKISGYVFTSSVNYFCNDGYILAGRALRYCQSDGHWGGELPVCKPVKCNQPEDPQNGRAFYDNYTFGSMVKYQCKTNYKLYGPNNRTCQSNREWSGDEPECKIIDCGQPESFPNGYIEIQSTTIGSNIYFFCFDGMIFDGQHSNATCLSNGSWHPYPFPKCLAPCKVPKIQNGHVDQTPVRSKIPHGQAINVTCIENYDLQYQSTHIVCYNGSWSQTPACVPARCKKLPLRPKNGFVVAPKTDHGMRALFICHDGFTLEGSNLTFCHFGVWNVSSPICNPIYCPFPGYLENGKIMLVGHMGNYDYRPYIKHVTNNRQIIYECDRGYHIVDGPPGATCIGGQWSPMKLPNCELFSHPKLSRWNRSIKTMMHFNYSNEQEVDKTPLRSYNEPITATITPTEHLSSAHHRKKRHHSKPPCIGLPSKPSMQITIARLVTNNGSNSQDNITTYPHGTRIRLACDDGFVSTNPNRTLIKCAKGRWKPELPDCVPAPCMTPTVANAKFHLHRRLLMPGELVKHDQRIELLCDEGYQQQSQPLLSLINVTLRCAYGSWMDTVSNGVEVCVPKPCKLPKRGRLSNGSYQWEKTNVGEATRSPIVWVDHESWIPFECNPGFRPNQLGQYRCMFGRFDPEPPRCVEEVVKSDGLNDQQDAAHKDPGSDNQNSERCRSPEKIENALLYFDQFLSEKLTLIGLAQFDQKLPSAQHPDNGQPSAQRLDYRFVQHHQPMPFEYEHGTEIVFRCVTYAQHYAQQQQQHILANQESFNQTMSTKRSTWIIRCDNGNWIGQSFECEKDFAERLEPEERQELSLINGEDLPQTNLLFPQVDIVEQLFDQSFPGVNKSCVIQTNDTNLRMYLMNPDDQSDPSDLTELELKNGSSVANGVTILLTCVDIGRFQLIGPSLLQCYDGVWSQSGPFYCAGLSQEYNNSLDKPPTILFRNQLGPIGQSIYGKLVVYPGTILHLDCLWQRRYGTPQWSWKLAKRQYLQYWTTDSSLEYRLTIFHAQDSDSGIYTCQTPNLHIHSVEIKVQSVHCPDLNLTIEDIDAITPTSSITPSTTLLIQNDTSLTTIETTAITTMLQPLLPKKLTKFQSIHGSILRVVEIKGTGVDHNNPSHYNRMGTLIKFECDLGTTLVGADSIECSPEGLWTAKIPKCNVTECYDLTKNLTEIVERMNKIQQQQPATLSQSTSSRLEPAQIVEMNRTIGAKVIFTCPRGYGLQGSNHELECLITGDWSGSIPYCQEVRCGEPLIPKNGYIEGISMDQLNVYYAGDIVQYACDDGYMIDGNPISICQENGRWSGPITKCKPSCPYPGLMHGSRLVSEVKFFYEINETIRFECFDGTIMKGNALIKCVASGRWSGPIPDCIPLFQDNPENVEFFNENDDSIEGDNV